MICVVILWLGGCGATVTVAKKYPMSALPYVEWQADGDRRSIDQIEFINLSGNKTINLSKFSEKQITFSLNEYDKNFTIPQSKYKVKWKFNPLKIIQKNANQ